MSSDPLLIAFVGAAALLAAAYVGTRYAADKASATSAKVAETNARSADRIEQIKAEAQLNLERDKERRQWRNEQAAPLLAHLSRMTRLTQRRYCQ
jgi:hypothetical protein